MQSRDHFSYDEYDRLTRSYVDQRGDVDYPGLKKDLAALKDFIDQLAAVSPENKSEWFHGEDERKRYYLTAYNAYICGSLSSGLQRADALESAGYHADDQVPCL
jgi:hypothetical protein